MAFITAWKTPGTCASADRDGKAEWANPDNAKASDDSRAQSGVVQETYSDWLRCTNFGFDTDDIPSGATIIGIEMKLERKAIINNYVADSAIYLRDSGGQTGDDGAFPFIKWTNVDVEKIHGGKVDDWNAGLSDSDVRASSFGVDISARNTFTLSSVWCYIDCVSIRIHFTLPLGWVTPTSDNDPDTAWTDEANIWDDNEATYGYNFPTADSWGSFIELFHAAISCIAVRIKATKVVTWVDQIDVDVHYEGEAAGVWHHVYSGTDYYHAAWTGLLLPDGEQSVDGARARMYNDLDEAAVGSIYEFDFGQAVAAVTVGRLVYGGLVNSGLTGGRLTG